MHWEAQEIVNLLAQDKNLGLTKNDFPAALQQFYPKQPNNMPPILVQPKPNAAADIASHTVAGRSGRAEAPKPHPIELQRREQALVHPESHTHDADTTRLLRAARIASDTIEQYTRAIETGHLTPAMVLQLAQLDARTRRHLDRVIAEGPSHSTTEALRLLLNKGAFDKNSAYNWWQMPARDRSALLQFAPPLTGETLRHLLTQMPDLHRVTMKLLQDGVLDAQVLNELTATGRRPSDYVNALLNGRMTPARIGRELQGGDNHYASAAYIPHDPLAGDHTANAYRYVRENRQSAFRNWFDLAIKDLVEQVRRETVPDRIRELNKEINSILIKAANEYAERLGLVVKDPTGRITSRLINESTIELLSKKMGMGAYLASDGRMFVVVDQYSPTTALRHELIHLYDRLVYQSFFKANRTATESALFSNFLSGAGAGGKRPTTGPQPEQRVRIEDAETRAAFRQLLESLIQDNYSQRLTSGHVAKWLQSVKGLDARLDSALGGRDKLVDELQREFFSFHVISSSLLKHGQVSRFDLFVDQQAAGIMARSTVSGIDVADNPALMKVTRTAVENYLSAVRKGSNGPLDPASYTLADLENRARRHEGAEFLRRTMLYDQDHRISMLGVNEIRYENAIRDFTQSLERFNASPDEAAQNVAWAGARESAIRLLDMQPTSSDHDVAQAKALIARFLELGLVSPDMVPEHLKQFVTSAVKINSSLPGSPLDIENNSNRQGHSSRSDATEDRLQPTFEPNANLTLRQRLIRAANNSDTVLVKPDDDAQLVRADSQREKTIFTVGLHGCVATAIDIKLSSGERYVLLTHFALHPGLNMAQNLIVIQKLLPKDVTSSR